MTRALESGAECGILKAYPNLAATIDGYTYRIDRIGNESFYSVTNGRETVRVPVEWAFGQGSAGQTYLFERNGRWYESRVSYYSELRGLDLTMGAQDIPARNLDEAAGRITSTQEAGQCFNCHATNAVAKKELTLFTMAEGIQCERCHEDSAGHLSAVRTGDAAHAPVRKLGSITSEEMSNFCGECHRTWSQIAMSGPQGILNVRFQPYRLENSKCFDADDNRIRCTACHDPHSGLRESREAYDTNCKSCHSRSAMPPTRASMHICRVATKDCVTCHMPLLGLPGAHKKFTDHDIRIARANDKYPN